MINSLNIHAVKIMKKIEKNHNLFMIIQNNSVRFTYLSSTAFLMAAIAGFTDVLAFVGVDRLFTAHITGNLVIAISDIINHIPGVASKIISLPVFVIIAILVTLCIEACGQKKGLLTFWFVVEALFLTAFMFGGVAFLPDLSVKSLHYIGIGMLAVIPMAIHNTLLRTYMSHFPPCTVMTGNMTQLIVDLVSHTWGWRLPYNVESKAKSRVGIKRFGNVFIAFLVGGGLAAVGYSLIGFWIVVLDIVALLFMAIKCQTSS
jgi:uncharacterized membrane protein YoaK (UPF0700 family)